MWILLSRLTTTLNADTARIVSNGQKTRAWEPKSRTFTLPPFRSQSRTTPFRRNNDNLNTVCRQPEVIKEADDPDSQTIVERGEPPTSISTQHRSSITRDRHYDYSEDEFGTPMYQPSTASTPEGSRYQTAHQQLDTPYPTLYEDRMRDERISALAGEKSA